MSMLDQYFDGYAEQSLDDGEQAAFCVWLRSDQAHVDEFAQAAFLHWQLLAIGERRMLQAEVSETPAAPDWRALGLALRRPRPSLAPEPKAPAGRGFRRRYAAAAAALLVAAATVAGWKMVERARPVMVAQLTQMAPGAAFVGKGAPTPGSFLARGSTLALDEGRILATLGSGVQLWIEGPAEVRLDSSNSVRLVHGRMTVAVPRGATGFVVDSRVGRFVDLGTEYTVRIARRGVCQLNVFSGLVELQLPDAAPAEGPLRIPEGRAMTFDAATGKVTTLPYDVNDRVAL